VIKQRGSSEGIMEPSTTRDRRRLKFRHQGLLEIRTLLRSWWNTVLFILKNCETSYTEYCTSYFRKTFLSVWSLFSKEVKPWTHFGELKDILQVCISQESLVLHLKCHLWS